MNPQQQRAVLRIALAAAFADGNNDDREREAIRRLAESLGGADLDLPGLYRDTLLDPNGLAAACALLGSDGERRFAYEMAVCICDADGRQDAAERAFLGALKERLGLDAAAAADAARAPDQLAELLGASGRRPAGLKPEAAGRVVAVAPQVPEAEIDRSILNYAILNGALELLPQTWASMAIIPLQVKMVYAIGKTYGNELDPDHIKEFIATVGVGLTSQYLEQIGRRLIGGWFDRLVGGKAAQVGRTATGMVLSFATTWALGQVARRYYAGGRQMNVEVLRSAYSELLGPAREMQSKYLPDIKRQAAGLDASKIMAIVRGDGR